MFTVGIGRCKRPTGKNRLAALRRARHSLMRRECCENILGFASLNSTIRKGHIDKGESCNSSGCRRLFLGLAVQFPGGLGVLLDNDQSIFSLGKGWFSKSENGS